VGPTGQVQEREVKLEHPDPLDALPLELLIALQTAMADPSELGRQRAERRARDAGIHIACVGSGPPLAMEPAPEGGLEAAVELRFEDSDRGSG
jgi:hypothetical protein